MNLDNLKNLIFKEKINLVECPMTNTKARIIRDTNEQCIFIDKKQIHNPVEEKCILAEELGHYYNDALYSPLYFDKVLIDKNEYKATKWAFKTLIDKQQLISLCQQNLNKYEIAQELEVTEELLEEAYKYYMHN